MFDRLNDEKEKGVEILEAHQEMVGHIERGARRIRVLSVVTIVVAAVLLVSYVYQLLLPLTGVKNVTVDLTAPSNQVAEVLVLILVLAWLYVGVRNLRFSSKMSRDIAKARTREEEVANRLGNQDGN
jgi:hypothetical protein